jgi:hypothetical protein
MRYHIHLLLSTVWLLLSHSAQAIIDTNTNGMSDLWEKKFNNGQLFAATFLPGDDADQDGQSNLQEAIAGTDPLHFNPPEGHFIQSIRHLPATWLEIPDEEPILITPAAFEIEWQGLVGKQYTLLASYDLTEGGWHPVGEPIIGSGTKEMFLCLPEQEGSYLAEKVFWRVAVKDFDGDSDGLTDAEEREIGSSPYFADTNNDGVSDAEAYASGNDPSADTPDRNGDGIPDNHLYSIMIEYLDEQRNRDSFRWHSVLTGVDDSHRYMTKVLTETYSISDSPRYQTVANGVYSMTNTCKNPAGNFENMQREEVGIDLDAWLITHDIDLGHGESIDWEPAQTTVVPSPTTSTLATTTKTITRQWTIYKNDNPIRNGTETIVETIRTELFDPFTIQDVWSYFKTTAWQEDEHGWQKSGPPEDWEPSEINADTAWWIRNIYHSNTSLMHSQLSWPYQGRGSCRDSRLKAMRWRWVKFNPLNPAQPEYTAPPIGYQSSFYFQIFKWDRDYANSEIQVSTLGLVELRCTGAAASGDWNNVDMSLFESYRVEDPWRLTNMDFTSAAGSAVFLRGCDAGLKKRIPVIADNDDEATWYAYERVSALPREVPLPGVEIYQKDIADSEITLSAKIYDPVADLLGSSLPHAWVNSRSVTPEAGDKPGVYKLPDHTYTLHPGRNEITVAVENALGARGYETIVVEGDEETGYELNGVPLRVPERPTYPVVFTTPGAESTQVTLKIGAKTVQSDLEPQRLDTFGECWLDTKPFLSVHKPQTATPAQIAAIPEDKPLFISQLEDDIIIKSSFPSMADSVLTLPHSGMELSSPALVEVLETTVGNPQLAFKARCMGGEPFVKAMLTSYRVDEAQEDVKSKILTAYQDAWQALPATGKDAVVSFDVEDMEYQDGYNGLSFSFCDSQFLNHSGRHDSFRFPAPFKAGVRVFSANWKKDTVQEGVTGRMGDIWYPVTPNENLTEMSAALASSGCHVVGMTDVNGCFEDSPLKRSFLVRGPPGHAFQAFDNLYAALDRDQRSQTFDADGNHGPALASEMERVQSDDDLPLSARNALALEIAETYQLHNGFEDFVPTTHQPYIDPGTGTPQPNSWTMRGSSLPDHPQSNPKPWSVTHTLSDPARAASVGGIIKVDTTAENTAYYATTDATSPWDLAGARAVSLRFKLLEHDAANGANGAFQLAVGDGTRTWTCQIAPTQIKVQGTNIALPISKFPSGLIDGKLHTLQINLKGTGNDALVSIDGEVLTTATSQLGTLNGISFGDPGADIAGKLEIENLNFENSVLRYQYGYITDDYANSDEIDGANNILLYLRSRGQAFHTSPIARWVKILDPTVHEWLLSKYTGQDPYFGQQELTIFAETDVWLGSIVEMETTAAPREGFLSSKNTKTSHCLNLDKEETKIFSSDQTRTEMQLAGILMAWCYEQPAYWQWMAEQNGQFDEIIRIEKKHLVENIAKCAKRVATTLEVGGEIAISMTNEWADYAITINSISQGDYMAMVGFIPLLPSSTAKAFKFLNKTDGATIEAIHQLSTKLNDFPGGIHSYIDDHGITRKLDFDKLFCDAADTDAVQRLRNLTGNLPVSAHRPGLVSGKEVLSTFANGSVTLFKTKEPLKVYRVYKDGGTLESNFFLFEKPQSLRQAVADQALMNPQTGVPWQNYDRYVEVVIPADQYVYLGYASKMTNTAPGGGTQIWVDDATVSDIDWVTAATTAIVLPP